MESEGEFEMPEVDLTHSGDQRGFHFPTGGTNQHTFCHVLGLAEKVVRANQVVFLNLQISEQSKM